MDVRAYAELTGRKFTTVQREIQAASVAKACTDIDTQAQHFSQLVEIHAAPQWLWLALVRALLRAYARIGAFFGSRSLMVTHLFPHSGAEVGGLTK